MDTFEYLVALVSVVAALGFARALSGIARLIQLRDHISMSWIHFLWTVNILLWLVAYWWFTFLLSTISVWSPPLLLFVLFYGALIFFLIAMLHPDRIDDGLDLFEYLIQNRKWFFGGFLVVGLLDLTDTAIKIYITETGGPPIVPYVIFMCVWILPCGVAIYSANRRFHATYAVAFFLAVLLHMRTILGVIET